MGLQVGVAVRSHLMHETFVILFGSSAPIPVMQRHRKRVGNYFLAPVWTFLNLGKGLVIESYNRGSRVNCLA